MLGQANVMRPRKIADARALAHDRRIVEQQVYPRSHERMGRARPEVGSDAKGADMVAMAPRQHSFERREVMLDQCAIEPGRRGPGLVGGCQTCEMRDGGGPEAEARLVRELTAQPEACGLVLTR